MVMGSKITKTTYDVLLGVNATLFLGLQPTDESETRTIIQRLQNNQYVNHWQQKADWTKIQQVIKFQKAHDREQYDRVQQFFNNRNKQSW